MRTCPNCGNETNFRWYSEIECVGDAVQGRLNFHDTRSVFILSCEDCFEVIQRLSGDEVADILNVNAV